VLALIAFFVDLGCGGLYLQIKDIVLCFTVIHQIDIGWRSCKKDVSKLKRLCFLHLYVK
jgi:hypothetical protein